MYWWMSRSKSPCQLKMYGPYFRRSPVCGGVNQMFGMACLAMHVCSLVLNRLL
jgi:hypothetical protein